MDRYLVISSDCHAGLQPGDYRDYLDPQHREAFDVALPLQIAQMEESAKTFLVADINEEWRKGRDEALTGAWDHDQRVRVLDADGVAGEIVFPDGITEMNTPPFGAGLGLPTEGVDPELQWAGAKAHNRWLAELCEMAPERRVGVAVVPMLWDVERAAEYVRELRRTTNLRAVLIPNVWGAFAPYHHPRYEPFWRVCAELDVIIHFHSGATPRKDHFGEWPANSSELLPGSVGIYITEVSWFVARPITYLIWGGVFERHPTLKVVVTEGTCSWAPELLKLMDLRYDHGAEDQKLGDYRSHMSLRPSEYFRRNVALGASCVRRSEVEQRHDIGLETIMWGTDFPHPEGSWPHTHQDMREVFTGLPDDEVAAMLGGNAARFYGFDTEKLAPLVARIGPEKQQFRGETPELVGTRAS
ncbi:amidohydrolase [Myxococcota bacterium]|nr:amidohydrolase [Myxococcota bacterium]